jgi:hypothetical protein
VAIKPLTPEETQALMDKIRSDPFPAEISRKAALITKANHLAVVCFLPQGSRNVYHVLVAVDENNIGQVVAILPEGETGAMLNAYDSLITEHGGVASDPEFKGTLM